MSRPLPRKSWFHAAATGLSLVLVAVLTGPAIAAAPSPAGATKDTKEDKDDDLPVLDDPSTDRVFPDGGALEGLGGGPTKIVKKIEEPKPEDDEATIGITVHGRVTGWAGFMLDLILDTHPGGYLGGGAGLAVEYGPRSWQVVVELDWTKVGMPNYVYREKGVPAAAATYAEIDWHLISVDVSYQGMVDIIDGFRFLYRLGAGLGGLAGPTKKAEVLPTCTLENIQSCPHWRSTTVGEVSSPLPVIPVLHIALGFDIDLGDVANLRIQGGFRDAFYGGLGVRFNL